MESFDVDQFLTDIVNGNPVMEHDTLAAELLLRMSEGSPKKPQAVSVPDFSISADVAAVVKEAAAAVIESGQDDFDADEEQRKLLNLLALPPAQPPVVTPPEPVQLDYRTIKCANCMNEFSFEEFNVHVCDYDENQQLIASPTIDTIVAATEVPKEPEFQSLMPEEPQALRLLRENQIRIRRFLKEELKYEIPFVPSQHSNTASSNAASAGRNLPDSVKKSVIAEHESNSQDGYGNEASNATDSKTDSNHVCSICERRFVHASGLLRHIEKHTLDLIPTTSGTQNVQVLRVVIKCQVCGRVFFDVKTIMQHFSVHFPDGHEENMEMDNCMHVPYETFVDDAIACIQREQQKANPNGTTTPAQDSKSLDYFKILILANVLQCEFCDYIFADVSYLFLHSSVHPPQYRFECLTCGINNCTSKEITIHFQSECVFMRENLKVQQANVQRYFVCNVCVKKFQTLESLIEHRYTEYHFFPRYNETARLLQAPCEFCDHIFDKVQELVVHYNKAHARKYKREKESVGVGGAFVGGAQHSNKLRQYLCDICGKSYTQSSHLWQHLRFHQGVKPFVCLEPGCSRKFTIRPDLHDHIRKCHTGERPFHCHICGKRFLTGSVFYQHRLIHRGERRYECNECGKRFYRADALKNHLRIHTGEKPFRCEYCTKSFRQRGDCDKHTRARHAHLDENTRAMLKWQKFTLESAAAIKDGKAKPQPPFDILEVPAIASAMQQQMEL